MRAGTPGFVGARLREAREARGLSGIVLAELVGVSRQAISQYESDAQSPRPEVMAKLPHILRLPSQFFFRPTEADQSLDVVFYRSFSAATKAARTKVERRFEWLKELVTFLRGYVEFPDVDLPQHVSLTYLGDVPPPLDYDLIETIAEDARRHWQLGQGPISDVLLLLENAGIIATRGRLDSDHLDAFSEFDGSSGAPYIFLGADKASAVRSRFDAAHELGHLLLHRQYTRDQVARPDIHKRLEEEANRFAGAFLFPAKSFIAEVTTTHLELFYALKSRWKVAIAMMLTRGRHLGVISEDESLRLWKSYNRRGWRKHEPLDDELHLEQPRTLRRTIEMLVDHGAISKAELLNKMPYSPLDLEELATLEEGYLEPQQPQVKLLQFPNSPVGGEGLPPPQTDNVILFPKKTWKEG